MFAAVKLVQNARKQPGGVLFFDVCVCVGRGGGWRCVSGLAFAPRNEVWRVRRPAQAKALLVDVCVNETYRSILECCFLSAC